MGSFGSTPNSSSPPLLFANSLAALVASSTVRMISSIAFPTLSGTANAFLFSSILSPPLTNDHRSSCDKIFPVIKFTSNVVSTFTSVLPSVLRILQTIFASLPPGTTSIDSTVFLNPPCPSNILFISHALRSNFSAPVNALAPSENLACVAYGKTLRVASFPSRMSLATCRRHRSTAGLVPVHSNESHGSRDRPDTTTTSSFSSSSSSFASSFFTPSPLFLVALVTLLFALSRRRR
mmetsp:Transcript_5727/g.16841  ORF Transcript_5727/g.16841 Transcript_5727/m.16841 type:complete len:236 (-) Transcript_5727:184-891(-)